MPATKLRLEEGEGPRLMSVCFEGHGRFLRTLLCPLVPGVALCRVVPRAVNETSRKVSQYLEKAPIRNTLPVSPPEIGILVYNDDNQWVVWVSKTFYQ